MLVNLEVCFVILIFCYEIQSMQISTVAYGLFHTRKGPQSFSNYREIGKRKFEKEKFVEFESWRYFQIGGRSLAKPAMLLRPL